MLSDEILSNILSSSKANQNKIFCFKCFQTPLIEIKSLNVKLNCECGNKQYSPIKNYLNSLKKLNICINPHCSSHSVKNAIIYCTKCKEWICDNCLISHKNLENHLLIKTDDLKFAQVDKHKKHKKYYCIKCKDYYCSQCLTEHNNLHSLVDLRSLITMNEINMKLEEINKGERYLNEYYNQIKIEYFQKIEEAKSISIENNRNILMLMKIIIGNYSHSENSWITLNNIMNILDNTKFEFKSYNYKSDIISFFEKNVILKEKKEINNRIWTIVKSDKSKYKGEWQNNEYNGYGIYTYSNGDKYEGEWENNKFNGNGIYTCSNGEKYEGEWKDDLNNGYGVYFWPNGEKYEGEWENDQCNGIGIFTYANGEKYEGEWEMDKKNGYGIYTNFNGEKYEGEWENDQHDGYGIYIWSTGEKYEGEWKNDEYDGYGRYFWSNGKKYEGQWKDNQFLLLNDKEYLEKDESDECLKGSFQQRRYYNQNLKGRISKEESGNNESLEYEMHNYPNKFEENEPESNEYENLIESWENQDSKLNGINISLDGSINYVKINNNNKRKFRNLSPLESEDEKEGNQTEIFPIKI